MEATAGIRNTSACAIIIVEFWLMDQASATNIVWFIGKPRACRIWARPVKC